MRLLSLVMLFACSDDPATSQGPGDQGTDDTGEDEGDGLTWPAADWAEGSPADHGLDPDALEDLRAYTFTEAHNSQALVVVKDGVLVAEWYLEGTDADTPVTSWSAAKSVTSALVGVAIRDGLLSLDDTVGTHVDAWAEGPNSTVTLHDMLTMRSGLSANWENSNGIYFENTDQLAYALDRELIRDPGTEFEYVNEDSMVLGAVLSEAFGREAGEVAQDEIFDPIGLDATWWTDGSGHSLTYCCIDSTARDLARFGLLFSRDGSWQGTEIVPADYVAESTTGISYYGYYGLHWWTFGEIYAAMGLHGQLIYVMPSEDLVVARFGTYAAMGDEAVRTGGNWHATDDYGPFDPEVFVELFTAALVESDGD